MLRLKQTNCMAVAARDGGCFSLTQTHPFPMNAFLACKTHRARVHRAHAGSPFDLNTHTNPSFGAQVCLRLSHGTFVSLKRHQLLPLLRELSFSLFFPPHGNIVFAAATLIQKIFTHTHARAGMGSEPSRERVYRGFNETKVPEKRLPNAEGEDGLPEETDCRRKATDCRKRMPKFIPPHRA